MNEQRAKIVGKDISREQLLSDLDKYRQEAIRLGMTDAKVITIDQIVVDTRVRGKCRIPMCMEYGVSANCPPHSPTPAQTQELIGNYQHGIFMKKEVRPEGMAGPDVAKNLIQGKFDPEQIKRMRAVMEIPAQIESMAFYDGYYFALAYGGACKIIYCAGLECQAIKEGQHCRFPYRSRPSMESAGMDVFRMCAQVGWDIYQIGSQTPPETVPCGTLAGLVLIT
jgi:predicted metal-binding protein